MNIGETIKNVEKAYLRKKRLPAFKPGDVIKVFSRIKEGEKERIQVFEGMVIGRKGTHLREMIKVRRIASGVGVERTYNLHSPLISDIKIVKHGEASRAKLYYLRGKTGKHARVRQMRREKMLQLQAQEQSAMEAEQVASALAAAQETASAEPEKEATKSTEA